MKRVSPDLRVRIKELRSLGKTYGEIRNEIGQLIPKSTLSSICSTVQLPPLYKKRIQKLNLDTLNKARVIGAEINKIKREEMFQCINDINTPIAKKVKDVGVGKIALAMLCLGEASKYNAIKPGSFSLGNSDPRIICLFLDLLRLCFMSFDMNKIRCSVQCRADQDTEKLKIYWKNITGIPDRLFYKAYIDPRTVGKITRKKSYNGVLRIYYLDTRVQLELESLADLVYNQIHSTGPVVYR